MHYVSANLDSLKELSPSDDYLLHNYKWEVVFPDVPNKVRTSFESITEAMGFHHELWKLHVRGLFKTWI